MNSELIFRIIFGILYILAALIRVFFSRKAQLYREKDLRKRLKKAVEQEGELGFALLIFLFIFFTSSTFLYVVYPERFAIPLPLWLRWSAMCFGIATLPLLLWIHYTIGKYWSTSLELIEQHRLVTEGPYRWVRHPMYTQAIVFFVALSFVSANLFLMLSSIIVVIVIFNRMSKEESMMIERFGDQYLDYMKRTGRLLPRIGHSN